MDLLNRQRSERVRKAHRTSVLGVAYQGVYAASQLVGLGLLVRYVGQTQYGLWMTVLAMTAWMSIAGIGQNSVLLTKLGSVALTNPPAAKRVFSASVTAVAMVSTVLILVVLLIGSRVPWGNFFNVTGTLTDPDIGFIVSAALTISLLAAPAALGSFSVFSYQRGDLVHIVMGASSLVSLAATAFSMWLRLPLWLVGAITLSGPLIGGIALWILGLKLELVPRPRWSSVDRATLSSSIKVGVLFLFIDAATLMLQRTPDLIVARIHGVGAVGSFASVGRLPLLMMALFQAVLLPFWPAIGDAAHRGDRVWIRRIVLRTLLLVMGVWLIGAVGIWFFGSFFVRLWTGVSEFANDGLIAAACVQSLGLALFAWLAMLLSALSEPRMLAMTSGIASVVFLPLAYLWGHHFGPVGVAMAQAFALVFCAVPVGLRMLSRAVAADSPTTLNP
jgi:O-antigen/teichoic acid export membrane protein